MSKAAELPGHSTELPSRAATNTSLLSDAAVPESDPSTTAGLLAERLQAWKHAVGYLEEYMKSVEAIHKAQAKEYERVLKTISKPLREGHHFDQSLGGVAGFFENLRANTEAMVHTNTETEKSLKGTVLPILERLHKEIKNKSKELAHGAEKSAKEVEKARQATQKQIEFLGQHTASFESTGGRMAGHDDPYVVRRSVLHRLHKQVMDENNHRNDLLAVQNNSSSFEHHVVESIQQAFEVFNQFAGGQAERTRALYSDMLGAAQRIPPDFEWKGFLARSSDRLVNANDPPRTVDAITFPNGDHPSTKALIEGTLERKSRNKLSWGYTASYYVVTPSKFLHEFKDADNFRADPVPQMSIYLPDATIGKPNGDKFNIKGKDKSKSMTSKLVGGSEVSFKAHTMADADRWFTVITEAAGAHGPAHIMSTPASPTLENSQHEGITGGDTVASPTMTSPVSPVDRKTSAGASPVTSAPTSTTVSRQTTMSTDKNKETAI